jgi:hypothetical protein
MLMRLCGDALVAASLLFIFDGDRSRPRMTQPGGETTHVIGHARGCPARHGSGSSGDDAYVADHVAVGPRRATRFRRRRGRSTAGSRSRHRLLARGSRTSRPERDGSSAGPATVRRCAHGRPRSWSAAPRRGGSCEPGPSRYVRVAPTPGAHLAPPERVRRRRSKRPVGSPGVAAPPSGDARDRRCDQRAHREERHEWEQRRSGTHLHLHCGDLLERHANPRVVPTALR